MSIKTATSSATPSAEYTDMQLYHRLLTYLRPYKARFTVALLASLPTAGIDGATAWVIGPFVDRMLKGGDYSFLLWVPAVVIGASALQGFFQYISQYCASWVGASITRDLRLELFEKLTQQEVNYFRKSTTTSGALMTRYATDPARLQEAIVSNLQDFIIQFFTFLALAGVLLYRNWQFAIVAIVIISLVGIPLGIISKKIRHQDHVTQEASSKLINIFYDFAVGVRILKSYGLIPYQRKRYKIAVNNYFSAAMRITKASTLLKPIMQIIASVGVGILILLGSLEVMHGRMTPGDLTSFMVALILMYKPAKTLGGVMNKIQRILSPAQRVFEKLDEEPGMKEARNPVHVKRFESLRFEHVWYEYVAGKPVLKNIDLTINAGDSLALVGQSGGGKSTLADLITRFIDPTEGRVLLNGIDLREVSFDSLQNLIAIVSQEPFVMGGSIRENIRLGKLNATDEEILQAARAAHLGDWLDTLPAGMETLVGERGGQLSGGQKQRITIARAFLRNPQILILDEATSALDNESEAMVQRALMDLQKGRTVIVIAHRLSTIRFVDRICVLDAGNIVETGTHDQLIDQNGIYAKLYYLQFRDDVFSAPLEAG